MLRSLPTGPSKAALAIVKQRAQQQVKVNDLYYRGGPTAAEAELRGLARAEASEYEDYDSLIWVLGEVTALVESRGQTRAKPRDIVLLSQDVSGVVSFYSVRAALKCVAGAGVRPLTSWDEAFAHWRHELGALTGHGTQVLLFVAMARAEVGEFPPDLARFLPEGDI
jgi:hypothetical protein